MKQPIAAGPAGGKPAVKARLTALLVHGMGASPEWWNAIAAPLERAGVAARALAMPELEHAGPETWREAVLAECGDEPMVLVGHSLGAAVCMEVARMKPPAGLVLLACPPFFPDFSPPPPETGLSLTATARVGRFLRQACAHAAQVPGPVVHFVGAADSWVPVEQARRLPFPLVVIPRAKHGLNRSATFITQFLRHFMALRPAVELLDPGVRWDYLGRSPQTEPPDAEGGLAALGLGECAPAPARLDIEITTRCQLGCQACARTMNADADKSSDMPEDMFVKTLDQMPGIGELFFVGLGEPLLHPQLAQFTRLAAARGIRVRMVTNGLLAAAGTLAALRDAGLAEVTFSIDSTEEAVFRRLRGNAPLKTVLENFRAVPAGLEKSIFTALSAVNAGALPGIVDLAAEAGLPALAVSDLNFAGNQSQSLARNDCTALIAEGIAYARRKSILLVGPHFHETADVARGYRRALIRKPADLAARPAQHRHCLAPWRVAVVSAAGRLTPCNCVPWTLMGGLQDKPFAELWNGEGMKDWRRRVRQGASGDCLVCPRY
jgi:MoaA/NifB/PqqE/SkfB family radical SAM enzyme/predicted alpha/beta hydrolase family esterase